MRRCCRRRAPAAVRPCAANCPAEAQEKLPLSRPRLAQHRLRFGDHMRSVVVRLDVLDGDRSNRSTLELRAEWIGDVTRVDLGIDRDRLVESDRILHARLEDADLAEGRARTGAGEVE